MTATRAFVAFLFISSLSWKLALFSGIVNSWNCQKSQGVMSGLSGEYGVLPCFATNSCMRSRSDEWAGALGWMGWMGWGAGIVLVQILRSLCACPSPLSKWLAFCIVLCILRPIMYIFHWIGLVLESLCYVWGPEVGGIAHLQSQGGGEAANPHRPVPQGFKPWRKLALFSGIVNSWNCQKSQGVMSGLSGEYGVLPCFATNSCMRSRSDEWAGALGWMGWMGWGAGIVLVQILRSLCACPSPLSKWLAFCIVLCILRPIMYIFHWIGLVLESLCYVWGPEVGGIAHLQSQGGGEAANPHRPVPQGFKPWTSGSEVQ